MLDTLLDYHEPETPLGVSGSRARTRWVAVHWAPITVGLIVSLAISSVLGLNLVPSNMVAWRVAFVLGSWLPLTIALYALGSALGWGLGRVIENNYKTLLIGRYLRRRRIAWVSLIAVTLCTTMVLVVISVMGGWLNMFETSARGLSADLVVRTGSLAGFSGYEKMIDRFQTELPEVSAAVPTLQTFGLLNINHVKPTTVQVMGWPIDQIGRVNKFPESLYRQHVKLVDRLDEIAEARQKLVRDGGMSPAELARWCTFAAGWLSFAAVGILFGWFMHFSKSRFGIALATLLALGVPVLVVTARVTWRHYARDPHSKQALANAQELADLDKEAARINDDLRKPPSYDLNDTVSHPVDVPDDLKLADANKGLLNTGDKALDAKVRLGWGPQGRALYSRGPLSDEEVDKLRSLSESKSWGKSVTELGHKSHWRGMVASTGVVEIRMGPEGKLIGREPFKHHLEATLTVLGVSADGQIDPNNRADTSYWIMDDSHTGMWQYDMDTVYVPFDELQKDLGMGATQATSRVTGQAYTEPARTSEIHVKLKPGADPNAVKPKAQKIIDEVLGQDPLTDPIDNVRVETWRESGARYIDAIEHEKVLVVFLFTIISVVAIFLIFCIFYMIVAEKTKDIGIIKSVGATNTGVAGIFLGYGLVIGVIGGGLGLLCSYGIIHNINELHALMGKLMHIRIWSPEVYAFDKIPNTMDPMETAVIVSIAVLSSVLGALIPAIRAARMNPVEALRWE